MPAIDPELLPPQLKLYARTLQREFGQCRYLHYGLRGPANAPRSCQDMQRAFSENLQRAIDSSPQTTRRVLFYGTSLGIPAWRSAASGISTEWLTDARPSPATRPASLAIKPLDLGTTSPAFDRIVLEGSFPHSSQLGILSRCRELLQEDGKLLLFGEFLADDSRIERSPLPNLSSFRGLAERLGLEIHREQDYSVDAQASMGAFQQLLAQSGMAPTAGEVAEMARIEAEFASGRRCFRLFLLGRQRATADSCPQVQFGDIHSFRPAEVADLFQQSFNTPFNAALWHWKYQAGRGRAIVARERPGGAVVSHYGGAPRNIRYFGADALAIQICDVMTLPELRRQYGRNSLFFHTAATFLEREIGNTVDHLLGFGFPNQKAMNAALRLGLYEKTDDFVEIVYADTETAAGEWSVTPVTDARPALQREIDALWQRTRKDFETGIVGLRDWSWLKYRYFAHPLAAEHCYQCLLLRSRTGTLEALAVLKPHEGQQLLMDMVCPLEGMPTALPALIRHLRATGAALPLKMWITRGWLERVRLPGSEVNALGIEIPCNAWNPGPDSRTLAGAWWLTGGDMDFT